LALLDLLEGAVDLREEHLLPAAEPEDHRLVVLGRGEVHLVGEIVRVEGHFLGERAAGLAHELLFAREEQLLETGNLSLLQRHIRGPLRRALWPKRRKEGAL